MLIKITNKCSMGCSHCMENSTPKAGQHMRIDVFDRVLDFVERLEERAWKIVPPILLLSGGEATEHPDVLTFIGAAIDRVASRGGMVILITNGMWLDDPDLARNILDNPLASQKAWRKHLSIQVTNDPRFYPSAPVNRPSDPRIVYVPQLTHLIPLGRMKPTKAPDGIGFRKGPSSFNLRSLTRQFGDVREAIAMLRVRAISGMSGHCSPSISYDGTLVAGETGSCFPIGTPSSTADEVTRALVSMSCNKCGLVDGLTHEQKLAIGEARIHLP